MMTQHKANALHVRLSAMSGKFADPADRYTQEGANLLVPYLMGYGIEADRMVEWNLYEPEEIKLAIEAFRFELAEHPMAHVHWKRWCTRMGYTTAEVFQGCIEGTPGFIDLMRAARAWCRVLGIEPWISYPNIKAKPQQPSRPVDCRMPSRRCTQCEIIDAAARACGVTVEEISGIRRHPNVVMARSICAVAMRTLSDSSYREIAASMGMTNHSTSLSSHAWFSAVWVAAHRRYGREKMIDLQRRWKQTMQNLSLPSSTAPRQSKRQLQYSVDPVETRRTA